MEGKVGKGGRKREKVKVRSGQKKCVCSAYICVIIII